MSERSLSSRAALVVKRTMLIVAAAVVVWQMLAVNLSNFFVEDARHGNPASWQTALWWDKSHPVALARLGVDAISQEQPAAALALLRASIASNPANARPQMDVVALYAKDDKTEQSDRLATAANALMPVRPGTQLDLAFYWSSRERVEQAVQHLAVALVGDSRLRDTYFPQLLEIAALEQTRDALRPITENPTLYSWWDAFFTYVLRNAQDISTVTALVAMREDSAQEPLNAIERDRYVRWLREDDLIAEAYLYWVNGLQKEELRYLGYLFDGGFERKIVNTSGFDWTSYPPRNSGIRITTGETYGIDGGRALRASFSGKRIEFAYLRQNLYLGHGAYVLTGRVRPDNLKARRGLQWRVACNAGASGLLGESEAFLGGGDWRAFSFDFNVPRGCLGQVLLLDAVGKRAVDHEVNGTLWVDALRIERKK